MKKDLFKFSVQDIAEMAVMVAIAVLLDTFIKIPFAPTGGSINFSALPLFIVSFRKGWFKGLICSGIVFGLITCLLDGYGIACYPLEYLVAFGAICIISFFKDTIVLNYEKGGDGIVVAGGLMILSVLIWAVIRVFAATLDSVILWEYEFVPALVYNLGYVVLSAVFDAVLLTILMPFIIKLDKRF